MQYGIRLTDNELPWGEFIALLAGIMPETPLGQVVSIRAEKDPEIIKCFNDDQRRIRNEWRNRQSSVMPDENYDKAMAQFSAFFCGMAKIPKAGGDGKCPKA